MQTWPKFSLVLNEIKAVFLAENRWSPKKKVFAEIRRHFPSEIRNSKSFSGRKQVISKKKGLRRNSKGFSSRNQKFQGFFWPKASDLQKKKKAFTDFGWAPEPKNSTILVQTPASPSQFRLPNPFEGTVFIFGPRIGLKNLGRSNLSVLITVIKFLITVIKTERIKNLGNDLYG